MAHGALWRVVVCQAYLLVFAIGAASGQTVLSSDDRERVARAVVRVVALQDGEDHSSGSGTIVSHDGLIYRDGLIYTNRHVVAEADDYRIELFENPGELPVPRYHASLVGFSPEMDWDFAVLRIDRDAQKRAIDPGAMQLPALPLVPAADVEPGDRIFVFGYPDAAEGFQTFTQGSVTTVRNGTVNGLRRPLFYQSDALVGPGSSGGLAVNARAEAVGIPTQVDPSRRFVTMLSIDAVLAARAGSLWTSVPRLDWEADPEHGKRVLTADSDPHEVEMTVGGLARVDYLGGECDGYAHGAPDYRVHWRGNAAKLGIAFAADGAADPTLLVRRPDGSWACNDDDDASLLAALQDQDLGRVQSLLNPRVTIDEPVEGQYDIWVGLQQSGLSVSGRLGIVVEPAGDVPAPAGGALDPGADPVNSAAVLSAGVPPLEVEMTAGGPVNVRYLGEACRGYALAAPSFRVHLMSGASGALDIFFTADGASDTTLLVRRPDGFWACDDDGGPGLDPLVRLENPAEGRYDIWVGAYERGETVSGTLTSGVLDLDLDPDADPVNGEAALSAGSAPLEVEMTAGGPVNAGYLAGGCRGYALAAPSFRVHWSGASGALGIFFTADDDADTTLLVRRPDGSWACDDDGGAGVNPSISLRPGEGRYDVWVGTYSDGGWPVAGRLGIVVGTSEDVPAPASGVLDPDADPVNGEAALSAGSAPLEVEMTAGGWVNAGYLGEACGGYALAAPSFRVHWSGASEALDISFTSDGLFEDTTLLVRRPDGSWTCDDDGGAGVNPSISLRPVEGQYDVWVGTYSDGGWPVAGRLGIVVGTSEDVPAPASGVLDPDADPVNGEAALSAGSAPLEVEMTAGGWVNAGYLGEACGGYALAAPSFRVHWSGASEALGIFFAQDDDADTTLLVRRPDGSWACDDDSGPGRNPLVLLENPAEGRYDIWVGARWVEADERVSGTLGITE